MRTKSDMLPNIQHFIDGSYTTGTSKRTFENKNPIDGSVICNVHEAQQPEVNKAVNAAKLALKDEWGAYSTEQRVEILYRIADEITKRFDDFLEAECRDTGKPITQARQVDIPRATANFKVFADIIKQVPTEAFASDLTSKNNAVLNYGLRAPKGVIGVIAPWNLPLLLMTWKLAPALAAGNTIVAKPSEDTPSSCALLGEVMNAAGVPAGVFNVVHGFGPDSAGAFICQHPDIDAITFTGETKTGTQIMRDAALGMRDISMELGGKNPAIIFADCDMDKAIEGTMRSTFFNCGQVCLGTERIYVESSIFSEFLSRFKEKAEQLKIGDPNKPDITMGPLVSEKHQHKVLDYYQKAKKLGATVVTGGGIPKVPDALRQGNWVEPTIWTGLDETSPIVKEEIFGPCCHIAPFDTEDEAIHKANDTDYGLACTIWTESLSKAHRVSAQVNCGIVWVNSWYLRDLRTAFGGAKQSGIGREGGIHSLDFYTETKNVCIKL